MEIILDSIRWTHIIAGFVGLFAWWVPILTRKGGNVHRSFGKVFKISAYIVLIGALLSVSLTAAQTFLQPPGDRPPASAYGFIIFLGYLALVTLIGLHHSLKVLENKRDLTAMNTFMNRFLAALAIASSLALISYALIFDPQVKILLLALSPIGIGTGIGVFKTIRGQRPGTKAWFYEHMGGMIGTGIAFHTAFAVFGSQALFSLGLSGWTALIPWVLPAVIGIPASAIWTRKYRRQFGDLPA